MHDLLRFCRLFFLLVFLVGCGSGQEATLTGVVSYQGKPLSYALINFHHQDGGPMAYTMTEADGSYTVLTGSRPGLAAGKYRLAIEPADKMKLPDKYRSIETSGLECVVEKGANQFDMRLE